MKPDVIILGAGAAGLAAAKVLSENNRRVLILEARGRLGGRIHTLRDPKLKIPIELGAEFVHGRPEVSWKMIREAGLLAFDLPFEHKRLHAGKLANLEDINHELAKVMAGLSHLGDRDESFADYLRRQNAKHSTAEARKFAISFIQGFDAADPEQISVQSIAEEQQGLGDVGDETQFRLQDGYHSLVEYLRRSLNPKFVKIRLKTPVNEIRWSKSKVEVRSASSRQPFSAQRVIITLPISILQIPPEVPGAVQFAPDISAWRQHAMGLALGPIVKVVLRFREAFWENNELTRDISFMHNPDAAFATFWSQRPLRVPILTAWAGGPKATVLAGSSRPKLLGAAIESLSPLVKMSIRRLEGMVDHVYFHDWAADPFSRGAYSFVTVGGMSARKQLAKPIENTLFFAGEALDTSGQASTVAGALASGQRAARQLLQAL